MASTYEEEGPQPWFRVEMSITFNELGEAELQDDMDKNQVGLRFKFLQFLSAVKMQSLLSFLN